MVPICEGAEAKEEERNAGREGGGENTAEKKPDWGKALPGERRVDSVNQAMDSLNSKRGAEEEG